MKSLKLTFPKIYLAITKHIMHFLPALSLLFSICSVNILVLNQLWRNHGGKGKPSTVEERRRGREESYMKITKSEINKLYYVDPGGYFRRLLYHHFADFSRKTCPVFSWISFLKFCKFNYYIVLIWCKSESWTGRVVLLSSAKDSWASPYHGMVSSSI